MSSSNKSETYFKNLISVREGNDEGSRWKWNETIGPVEDRPGRQGTWEYYNTDGLGMCISNTIFTLLTRSRPFGVPLLV